MLKIDKNLIFAAASVISVVCWSGGINAIAQQTPKHASASTSKNLPQIVIDLRPEPSPIAGGASSDTGSGIGAGVSGITDSGEFIKCQNVWKHLNKIGAKKAAATFSWYQAAVEGHKRMANTDPRQECFMILSTPDWQKLQKMSGLSAAPAKK